MNKILKWTETTTGHVMTVNEKNRWFIRVHDGRHEIYEIVQGENGCLRRDTAYSLEAAKHRAYLIECNERNDRRRIETEN